MKLIQCFSLGLITCVEYSRNLEEGFASVHLLAAFILKNDLEARCILLVSQSQVLKCLPSLHIASSCFFLCIDNLDKIVTIAANLIEDLMYFCYIIVMYSSYV